MADQQAHSAEPFEPALSNEQIDALWKANWPNLDAVCRAIERAGVLADRERGCLVPCPRAMNVMSGQQAQIATLERQRAELERDARRYRMIRSWEARRNSIYISDGNNPLWDGKVDEFVDAALATQEGSSHGN